MTISKDDLLSIKDFSRLTGIKQSTLRYYDDLGLFTPAKRGENGYRFYSPQQIVTINSIHLLHELDMPIREISEIQNRRTPELMFDVFSKKEDSLEAELLKLRRTYNVVHTLRRMIQLGLTADEAVIDTMYLDQLPIVIGPKNDFKNSDHWYDAFLEFCTAAKQYRIDLRLPVGGYFNGFDSFSKHPTEPDNFFSVDPTGYYERPFGKFVVAYVRGFYGEIGNLLERLDKYISENKIKNLGCVYHIFLHDELSIDDPDKYLSIVTIQVL